MSGRSGSAAGRVFLLLTVLLLGPGQGAFAGSPAARSNSVSLVPAPPSPPSAVASSALAAQGRHVFERHCVICHGRWGDGRGDMARGMVPRPRRFTSGVFKYRTTPSGFLPTDADLARTIRNGISGTSMPTFAGLLGDRDIAAVIETVKTFSSKWDHAENQATAISIPNPPDWFDEPAYLRRHAIAGAPGFLANCAPCHGPEGRGNGPAGPTLEDEWGDPCPPADLTRPGLRSGPNPEDLYRTLSTGLNGTPMPAFGETLSEAQRWDLVAWILAAQDARREAANAASQAAEKAADR